jgi:soluble lytic murein transglycosylase
MSTTAPLFVLWLFASADAGAAPRDALLPPETNLPTTTSVRDAPSAAARHTALVAFLSSPLGLSVSAIAGVWAAADAKDTDTIAAHLANVALPKPASGRIGAERTAWASLLTDVVAALPADHAQRGTLARRVREELPETDAAQRDVVKAPVLVQARVFEAMQLNAEVVAVLGGVDDKTCEADLLRGKTLRKIRRYKDADVALDRAAQPSCDALIVKRARYAQAKLAYAQKSKNRAAIFQQFIADYSKTDPLSDDVMLWHARSVDSASAIKILRELMAAQPQGDMIYEANFLLAWLLANAGNIEDAVSVLVDVPSDSDGSAPHVLEQNRSWYWAARLRCTASVSSTKLTGKSGDACVDSLNEIARTDGIYALLAGALLGKAKEGLMRALGVSEDGLDGLADAIAATRQEPPQSLTFAARLHDAHHDDDAKAVLSTAVFAAGNTHARTAARLWIALGDLPRAHQTMRAAGFAHVNADVALAYPQAHIDVIAPAAAEAHIPAALLLGLAREESSFDASIRSWAGALGLCQLMLPTALEEAALLKVPAPTSTELLTNRALNARLGAQHIARRLRTMKNPVLAVAAYNAGPGAVARWLPATPVPTDVFIETIPVDETRNYVKTVIGSWDVYAQKESDEPVLPLVTSK